MNDQNHNGKSVELARTLHGTRVAYAKLIENVDALRVRLEKESPVYRELQRALILADETRKVEKSAEQELRDYLVKAFEETAAKNFGDGLEVQERAIVIIEDEERMMDWITEKARYVLSVSDKDLLKLCQSTEVPGTKLGKKPTAKISKDLSKYA